MPDGGLGGLSEVFRPHPTRFVSSFVIGVVFAFGFLAFAHEPLIAAAVLGLSFAFFGLSTRVQLQVRAKGILVRNLFQTRAFAWGEIAGFERSTILGRRGMTGAVRVGDRAYEILALGEPQLDGKLAHMGDELRRAGR